MIYNSTGTSTFPDFESINGGYTIDEAYQFAQETGWTSYFGVLFAWAFFACFLIQVYFYFSRFPNDRRLIKGTVVLLVVLEVGATTYLTWGGYVSHVIQWGHYIVFMPAVWGSMLFDCTVASVVHALYAWRIYKLISRRWLAIILTLIIMLLSTAQAAFCLAAAMCNATQKRGSTSKAPLGRKMFHGWLASAILADVIITTTMAIKLFSARTGVPSTDRSINKLLYVFIPGGAVTALVTLAILIIQILTAGNDYYQMLILCLAKFYSNSVLLCLNLRTNSGHSERRHSMLPTFATTEQSTGQGFDIKIERNVEKFTSSGTFRGPPSDGIDNTSEYGIVEIGHAKHDTFYACKGIQEEYPIDIDTIAKVPFPIDGGQVDRLTLAQSPMVEKCQCHPFQSTISVSSCKKDSSITLTSTEASRGHEVNNLKEASK